MRRLRRAWSAAWKPENTWPRSCDGAPAADTGAAAEGAEAGTAARVAPRLAAPLTAGEGAGAATAAGEAAEGDAFITVIERMVIWVAEHPYVLLRSYETTSPEQPWRNLFFRRPVFRSVLEI